MADQPSIVTVYSRPGCQQCTATTRTPERRGIDYTVVDVSTDSKAYSFVQGLGYRQLPVVVVGNDHHWTGFRPDLIADLSA